MPESPSPSSGPFSGAGLSWAFVWGYNVLTRPLAGKPFLAARYHSLTVTFSRTELVVTSYSNDGVIMGMAHPEFPLHGVQFHPESFLTEHGFLLVENFLKLGILSVQSSVFRVQEGDLSFLNSEHSL
jgi:hypothetical protein